MVRLIIKALNDLASILSNKLHNGVLERRKEITVADYEEYVD
jgi:hypothetical protein